jgi:transcription initiation factor TFIID subunit TAF12
VCLLTLDEDDIGEDTEFKIKVEGYCMDLKRSLDDIHREYTDDLKGIDNEFEKRKAERMNQFIKELQTFSNGIIIGDSSQGEKDNDE